MLLSVRRSLRHLWHLSKERSVQDEVLAHRLGLIPLNIDPDKFDFKESKALLILGDDDCMNVQPPSAQPWLNYQLADAQFLICCSET